ncbi:hypothetical protein N658DRAFT_348986 [Parathielavia hyrcaniae]|uniref:Uncharacterized protein n=1 Tax=Parathielavia hyrcaniae TaxID=113614 RepID=A0AAN6PRN1_9PEZI|nr:hypothetical protein N658DRAFT_348986 [Parathielavia hyrcaniae]
MTNIARKILQYLSYYARNPQTGRHLGCSAQPSTRMSKASHHGRDKVAGLVEVRVVWKANGIGKSPGLTPLNQLESTEYGIKAVRNPLPSLKSTHYSAWHLLHLLEGYLRVLEAFCRDLAIRRIELGVGDLRDEVVLPTDLALVVLDFSL